MNIQLSSILIFLCAVGGLVVFEWKSSWQEDIFVYSTYWFMLVLLMTFCYSGMLLKPSFTSVKTHIQKHALALVLMFVCAVILWASVPFDLRVLADESNLISTSRSLFDHKEFQNSISGKFYYDNYHSTHTALPIRPPLFAFILSLIHSVQGYTLENAGLLNFGCWIGVVYIIYLNTQKKMQSRLALCIIPLMLSIPILSLCARSGGFDVISVLLLCIVFHVLRLLDEKPTDPLLWVLWSTLLLFTHTRYENIVLLVFVVPYLIYKHRIHQHKSIAIWISAGLFFLLPKWFQIRFASGNYENEEESLLSLSNLYAHARSFLSSIFDISLQLPYNNILNLLGCMGCSLLIWDMLQKRISVRNGFELLCAGFLTCIFLSHFLGDPQNQTSLRFFLILNITLALTAVYTLHRLSISPKLFVLFCVTMACVYHPISVRNEYMNALVYPREARVVYDVLKPLRSTNTLVLVDMPGAFVVQDVGALSIEYANLNQEELRDEFHQKLYERILVVQRVMHDTLQPIDDDFLSEEYQLLPLISHQTSDEYFLRISEVLDIESPENEKGGTGHPK